MTYLTAELAFWNAVDDEFDVNEFNEDYEWEDDARFPDEAEFYAWRYPSLYE